MLSEDILLKDYTFKNLCIVLKLISKNFIQTDYFLIETMLSNKIDQDCLEDLIEAI
jgi:hypothetical protein